MASGSGMTARLGDQHNSGGFLSSTAGSGGNRCVGCFLFGDDRGVISLVVLYPRVD
jgi:hypothetical protein